MPDGAFMNRPRQTEPVTETTTARRALITGITGQDGSYLALSLIHI